MEHICSGGCTTPTAPVAVIKNYLWLCGFRLVTPVTSVICHICSPFREYLSGSFIHLFGLEFILLLYLLLFIHPDFHFLKYIVVHAPVYFREVLVDLAVVLAILRKLDLLIET